ncbi:EF_hand_5 domain-containing protein [Cephalotus follicularis]|uniref:EF_hand_5 domain-containing protein n=1 Tax=Cephalotus follicularis TaxID=3775 RepID=A0A1Q3CZL3_CEPFO|nr:EF_hand_5 domain-containing protein [Cephalotus follicularis]
MLRISLVYNLLNTFLLSLVPKKLIPASWYHHQNNHIVDTKTLPPPLPPLARAQKRMDPTELDRVFQMFDRNGDGRITKMELNESLEKLGMFIPDKELTRMIEKIDVDGDGCVDIDEFGALYRSLMDHEVDDDEEEEEDMMKEAFNVFDSNGDGFISVDELRSVFVSLGVKQGRTIEDCKKMIMKVDVDGDGKVDYEEFKQMMKGGGGGFSSLS